MLNLKINFFCPINNLGYGIVGKNLAISLNKFVNICLVPDNLNINGIEDEEINDIKAMAGRLPDINFNDVGLCLGYGNMMYRFCGRKRIGYTIFETSVIYKDWAAQLKQLDEVWTFSKWARGILNGFGINSYVVPAGVNSNIFNVNPELRNIPRPEFNFVSFGKWEPRKNQTLILQAFCKAFGKNDNVRLYCLWHNPFFRGDIKQAAASYLENGHTISDFGDKNNSSTIIFFPQLPSQKQIAQIFNQMDCGVFPYRAEGWCLPLTEAMACGLPCIATNYSAPVDFINADNCILLGPGKFIDIHQNDSLNYLPDSGVWADPDLDELISQMRFANENKSKIKNIGNNAAISAKKLSWENTAAFAAERLKHYE